MTSSDGSKAFKPGGGSLVDGLAMSVISRISDGTTKHRNRRLDIGTSILISAVMEDAVFDQDKIQVDLQALHISAHDIVDHCIPQAAEHLGNGWNDDTISFAKVSVASARLYGLCKAVAQVWDGIRPSINSRTILVVTVEREDHIIGPAVLTEQLRRRGHSVKIMQNCSGREIANALHATRYDGVLISVSSLITLEHAKEAIRSLAKQKFEVPIVLGGACVGLAESELMNTGADLVTNDINVALDSMTRDDVHLRVAE